MLKKEISKRKEKKRKEISSSETDLRQTDSLFASLLPFQNSYRPSFRQLFHVLYPQSHFHTLRSCRLKPDFTLPKSCVYTTYARAALTSKERQAFLGRSSTNWVLCIQRAPVTVLLKRWRPLPVKRDHPEACPPQATLSLLITPRTDPDFSSHCGRTDL